MKKLILFTVVIMLVLSVRTKAQNSSRNLEAAKNEIKQSNQLFNEAFSKGDSAAMVALYHSEAKIYPPNGSTLNQRSEMGHMITAIPSMGIKSATLTTTEVLGSGDLLIETGIYEMSDGTKAVDTGKYMVVWKKENGKYKMYRDIWNSDSASN